MKYDYIALNNFCINNNVILLQDYSKENVNRETKIQYKCKNCDNIFDKSLRQLFKTYNYCNDCMKVISIDKIKNKLSEFNVEKLNNYCEENNIILNESYNYTNRNTVIKGKCNSINCDNNFTKSFRQLIKLGGYCSDCCLEKGKEKIKKTNMEKYGVDYLLKSKEFREKGAETILLKYGVKHISQNQNIKDMKKEKALEKYGVDCTLKSKEIREKGIKTNLIKYNCVNPMQNENIKLKIQETNMKKYGVKNYSQHKDFKEKCEQTNLNKYGVLHHSQNAEIAEKMFTKAFNKKIYTLPSGKEITYQGYENFALDYLLQIENINENDIINSRKEVPEIWYNDKNGKKCRHFVDFFIPKQNKCIEVKSTWTNQIKNSVFEKQQAAKDLGYEYEIWIYSNKGELLNKYT